MVTWQADESRGWYSRVVRIGVCGSASNPANCFATHLDPFVQQAIAQDQYVIVDLHHVTDYGPGAHPQSEVLNFWNYVAPRYANNPEVIFEVFNEPINPDNWTTWKNYIQPVVDAIRAVAPNNLILMGGPQWSTRVNDAVNDPISGGNIVYVYHIYPNQGTPTTSLLDSKFGNAANSIPIIITEFGWNDHPDYSDNVTHGTTSGWGQPFRTYMDNHPHISWVNYIFDNYWKPQIFDWNWNLMGGENQGQFIKDWLYDKRNSDQPTSGGNQSPIADAGPDQTVTDNDENGSESVTLDGSGSSDPDGSINSYEWTEGGSQIATGISPVVSLAVGSHTITLTVTDNEGATATDQVIITVAQPAVTIYKAASAPVIDGNIDAIWSEVTAKSISINLVGTATGSDLSATWKALWDDDNLYYLVEVTDDVLISDGNGSESVTLDGSGSSDPDGSITSYVWKEGGTQIATGETPSVNLDTGIHTITLTVTDNDGAIATDQVNITVETGGELLTNPGFEDGTTGWSGKSATISIVTSPVHTGSQAVKVTDRSSYWNCVRQDITSVLLNNGPGEYDVSGWIKLTVPSGTGMVQINYNRDGSWTNENVINSASDSWTEISGTVTLSWTNLTQAYFYIWEDGASNDYYADDCSLTKVSGVAKRSATEETADAVQAAEPPEAIALHQNFPNPFNPQTSISYEIDKDGMVRLSLYDLTGREVISRVFKQRKKYYLELISPAPFSYEEKGEIDSSTKNVSE